MSSSLASPRTNSVWYMLQDYSSPALHSPTYVVCQIENYTIAISKVVSTEDLLVTRVTHYSTFERFLDALQDTVHSFKGS
jgi:hypothetical protein